MKPGDLVVPSNGMGCDLFSDEFAEVFPKSVRNPYTGIALMAGEIGTILEIKRINTNITSDNILKILAPTGIGWVYAHWVKVVK